MAKRTRSRQTRRRPFLVAILAATSLAFAASLPAVASDGEALYGAVLEGDAKGVKRYLDKGYDPNYRADDSYTPLLAAARAGNAEICRMLIDAGADLSVDAGGWTALHLAADDGHKDVVAVLLAAKVALDVKLGGDYTALDLALGGGHQEVIDLLAAAGAGTLEAAGTLFNASADGDLETVTRLVNYGVDVNWKTQTNHWTPLHAAAYDGRIEVVKFLLSKGADVHAQSSDDMTPLLLAAQEGKTDTVGLLLDAGSSLVHRDSRELTAIHRAALGGSKETLLLLLERGAKPNWTVWENTPLSLAAGEGHLELVGILIAKGADVNFRKDAGAFTALHRSATVGSYEVTKLLLSHGADPNVTNRLGKTPLQLAIDGGHEKMAELLRKSGAKKSPLPPERPAAHERPKEAVPPPPQAAIKVPNPRFDRYRSEWESRTPLTPDQALAQLKNHFPAPSDSYFVMSAIRGSVKVTKLFLDAGYDIDTRNPQANVTPLYRAAEYGNQEVALFLLAAGADPNVANQHGVTALMKAATVCDAVELVQVLIDAGANINAKATSDLTPLMMADRMSCEDNARLLRTAGAR